MPPENVRFSTFSEGIHFSDVFRGYTFSDVFRGYKNGNWAKMGYKISCAGSNPDRGVSEIRDGEDL